jgi:hypothetical protein
MTTFYAIFDNATSTLQWYGRAYTEQEAWEQCRNELGYVEDIPGSVADISAYHFETGATAIEIVKDMGFLN